jgi:hypothetical protein
LRRPPRSSGRSAAVLANDSGAAHLAVAAGTPVVAIFGPTDPATLWTWDEPDRYVALAGDSTCARPCWDEGLRRRPWIRADHPGARRETLSGLLAAGPERLLA